jgi:hypothetical protein
MHDVTFPMVMSLTVHGSGVLFHWLLVPCSGKTSLCKALSGRLPSNRVWGDISVLVSSSSSTPGTLVPPGTAAAAAAAVEGASVHSGTGGAALLPAAEVSHITGFVPQFDLLHESLTVSLTDGLCLITGGD